MMMMVMEGYFPSRYLTKPWIACLSNSAQLFQTHLSFFSLSAGVDQENPACNQKHKIFNLDLLNIISAAK